jgi:F0F1-type ATP synthase membrane subunit b/b'
MADLHSAAGNESRCNCFGRPGTNPGCPAHGNHATRPAESPVDGPTDLGAGETTSRPGWDRRTIQALIDDQYSYDRCHTPDTCYNCRAQEKAAEQRAGQISALLAERDRLDAEATSWKARLVNETEHLRARYAKLYDDARDERATLRHERDNARHNLRQALDDWAADAKQLTAERDAARADLDAALVTIRGQLVLQRTARRDAAAGMLDRAAAKLQAYSDVHSSTVAMLRRWAAEVRTIPPTDRSST